MTRLEEFAYFPGKYLWAEDGPIFLNESQSLGAAAIFKPYAGYLNLYPRLIAYLSSIFDLINRPLVTLGGWVFAYLLLAYALAKAAKSIGFGWFSSVALICLMSLQPNYGEVFFNITNSQWMLGPALVIFGLVDAEETRKQKIFKSILLIPLSLTGPFSIIFVPVLLLSLFLKKDWKFNKLVYLVVFFGAAIQLLVLVNSGRATTGEISLAPWNWFLSFFQLLLFGANSIPVLCAALLFWFLVIYSFIRNLYQVGCEWKKLLLPLLLLVAAMLFIFSGEYSHKHNPLAMVALGGGNRYTWVPYVLIFFSALTVSIERRVVNLTITVLAGFICFNSFHRISSSNLQFKSFVNYSQFQEVVIPINPQIKAYPGWHIKGTPSKSTDEINIKHIAILQDSISTFGTKADFVEGRLDLSSTGNDPMVIFKKRIFCKGLTDLAVEINLTRSGEGWMQLFWSQTENFGEVDSLRLWYPSGSVTAQFAFPISENGAYIRFDPMEVVGDAKIKEVKIYCL